MDARQFVELLTELIELHGEIVLREARGQQSPRSTYERRREVQDEIVSLFEQDTPL